MSAGVATKRPKMSSAQPDDRVDWKKRKEEFKEAKKKRKEAKLIKQLEKQKKEELAKSENAEQEHKKKGRAYTVSVALPGSVLDNAQSAELRTYLAGQIARACVIFCADEIVVFDEEGEDVTSVEGEFKGVGKKGQACVQLGRLLQYLEVPQYLRKMFFPKHQDLQYAGLLNPLDSPHHMRIDEESEYREGVVLDRPAKANKGSLVNCGMRKEVRIDKQLQAGLRVTVRLNASQKQGDAQFDPKMAERMSCDALKSRVFVCLAYPPESKTYRGTAVAPHVPTTEAGLYWGYSVRLASCLSAVFTEGPYEDGYDLTVGTSEKGSSVDEASLAPFKHLLVVFGGLRGLEASLDADPNLDVSCPSVLFDHYLNTCPVQGSRTIRTEEAILISMATLRQKIATAFSSA
ncbi:putative methyltransferase C9orf114 homolog isoform X1 [Syngnathoides biaculeatus]|uniref:putative methyltransferase C9orf114 homolog isoform X1 n=1 Tax=Syngnathoides biaculeatus TaxID=300417 RepID=UPI002ADE7513|nr:putative methyltransferase C9orf114 homolog isoform X1 [Syngnathoides biaculeatus]